MKKREKLAIRRLNWLWNMVDYRLIDGQLYPHQRPQRNFFTEIEHGKIKVIRTGKIYKLSGVNL